VAKANDNIMKMVLEDNYEDIIGKALRGLGMSVESVARQAGVAENNVQAALDGFFDENIARAVAPVLALNGDALVISGNQSWVPEVPAVTGMRQFTTHFACMLVNSYLVWDVAEKSAILFDTGAESGAVLEFIRKEELEVVLILLTHAHPDHVVELDRLVAATGADVFIAEAEALPQAATFEWGEDFTVGSLQVATRKTIGHSCGGTTFVISGLAQPLAIVGDAVFAGSMGGGAFSYPDALATNRSQIMTLADETILCPGHGPITTVGQEKIHNPFLAE